MKQVPKITSDLPKKIYKKYYQKGSKAYLTLLEHSECVAALSLEIANRHPEWKLDERFLYEAAMLHDVGMIFTDAPSIGCTGDCPYIMHGVLGADLLRKEGLERHALVCERHTGVGLTLEAIIRQRLPLPAREMVPISLEEQIICYADCFYSKSGDLKKKKKPESILLDLQKKSEDDAIKFLTWCRLFEGNDSK